MRLIFSISADNTGSVREAHGKHGDITVIMDVQPSVFIWHCWRPVPECVHLLSAIRRNICITHAQGLLLTLSTMTRTRDLPQWAEIAWNVGRPNEQYAPRPVSSNRLKTNGSQSIYTACRKCSTVQLRETSNNLYKIYIRDILQSKMRISLEMLFICEMLQSTISIRSNWWLCIAIVTPTYVIGRLKSANHVRHVIIWMLLEVGLRQFKNMNCDTISFCVSQMNFENRIGSAESRNKRSFKYINRLALNTIERDLLHYHCRESSSWRVVFTFALRSRNTAIKILW